MEYELSYIDPDTGKTIVDKTFTPYTNKGYTWNSDPSAWSHITLDPTSMYPPVSHTYKYDPLTGKMIEEYIDDFLDESKAEGVDTVKRRNVISPLEDEYTVECTNERDLSTERIFKCLSIMKSQLMMAGMPVKLENIECKMTPVVKTNLITAYNKLNMFGKSRPFVASYDEYGRRLPDEIRIETLKGMTIKIVDPKEYGELFLSFKGIAHKGSYMEDIPF